MLFDSCSLAFVLMHLLTSNVLRIYGLGQSYHLQAQASGVFTYTIYGLAGSIQSYVSAASD